MRPRVRWGGLGQLDVLVDGKLVFSKKQAGRSPSAAEIVRSIGMGGLEGPPKPP